MAVRAGQREFLDDLDKQLDELSRKFALYFQGSKEQRIPPTSNQAKLGGEMRRIREEDVRTWNTQDKFRFNQIFARFVSMDRVWARTMKQIEDGTYKRDKFKVQQMKKKDEAPGVTATDARMRRPGDSLDGLDVDVGSFEEDGLIGSLPPQKPIPAPVNTAPPRSAPQRPQPSGGGGGEGMSDGRLKQLYDVYMQAKKRTGESSSLTMDALKKQIEKQIPAIKAKHNCQTVDFKVVLKDGKAMLKAVPK
jgi:hypothetical protein